MHSLVKIVGGIGLRYEANSGAAEREGLLQMRQKVTDEQILFGGDGQTDGEDFEDIQPEMTGGLSQGSVGFVGISEVFLKCRKQAPAAVDAASGNSAQALLDAFVQSVAGVREAR
jgi:hypothetical protein